MSEVADERETAQAREEFDPVEERQAHGSSLRERMVARRQELEKRQTVLLPVPRYDQFVAVELKAISWDRTEKIMERHQRRATRQILNSAADELVAATVAFHEVKEEGTTELIEDVRFWSDVAKALADIDPPEAPHATAQRACLVALVGDQGVMPLNGAYRQWLGGANVGISDEVKQDFDSTP